MSDPDRLGVHLSVLPARAQRDLDVLRLFCLGGFLMDVGQVTSDPAYLRRRSREQLGLMRSRLTSCRRAIHRLPTPSLRCRRCNTGCNTGRPGHPARHRSSMSRRLKKLLPRNIFFFFFNPVCTRTHTHTHEPQFRTIVKFRQKCRCFDIWFKSTRTIGRISSKHKREKKKYLNMMKMLK